MSTFGNSGNSSPSGGKTEKEKKPRSLGQVLDFIAKWLVFFVGLPFRFAAAIVAQFVAHGGAGRAVVGGVMFLLGCAISTDSIWQTLFAQTALLPWFERTWIGWWGWVLVVLNPFFYLAFLIAVGIQVIEAYSLHGKSPDTARRDLEDVQQYDLEAKPSGKIDLSDALWKDYKKSGMRAHSTAGFVALALWSFDIITTFAARNPLQYHDPMTIILCTLFNIATMLAGEMGFAIWRLTKD